MTQELNERVIPFGEAVDTLHKFIHDPAGDVQTESGPMPNLRKINEELRQTGAVATVTEGVKTVQDGVQVVLTQGNYPTVITEAEGIAATAATTNKFFKIFKNGPAGLKRTTIFENVADVAVRRDDLVASEEVASVDVKRIQGDQTIRSGFDGMVVVEVPDGVDFIPVGYIDPVTGDSPLGVKPSTGELVARISPTDPGVLAGIDRRAAELIPSNTYVYDGDGPIIPFTINENREVIDGINILTGERVGTGAASSYGDPEMYILVWAIGQSNTSGRALVKSSYSFEAGQAYKYVRSSQSLQLLADPTGNDAPALTGRGSWGPSFADAIRRLSAGRIGTIIVNSAEGGTPISPNWLTGGAQWNQATVDLDNALAAAAALKLPLVGCCVYMQQGETDGDNGVSTADYVARYASLTTQIDNKIGVKVPFLMTRIGTRSSGDTSAYAAIRTAQNQIAQTVDGVYLVHTGTVNFAERGLMMDAFHYVIAGYDEIGAAAGCAAFGLALGARPLGYTH